MWWIVNGCGWFVVVGQWWKGGDLGRMFSLL